MADTPKIEVQRTNLLTTRLYAVLFTCIPIAVAIALFRRGGILGGGGSVLLLLLGLVSLRSALRFRDRITVEAGTVTWRMLWTRSVAQKRCRSLTEVSARIGLDEAGQIVAHTYQLRFEDGSHLFLGPDFPSAAAIVEAILREPSFGTAFPLRIGRREVLENWIRYWQHPELGVAASYRSADGTLVSFYVYGQDPDEIADGIDSPRVVEEFERAISDVRLRQQHGRDVREEPRGILVGPGGTKFLFASFAIAEGGLRTKSQLYLTGHAGRFLKARVTTALEASRATEAFRTVAAGLISKEGGGRGVNVGETTA